MVTCYKKIPPLSACQSSPSRQLSSYARDCIKQVRAPLTKNRPEIRLFSYSHFIMGSAITNTPLYYRLRFISDSRSSLSFRASSHQIRCHLRIFQKSHRVCIHSYEYISRIAAFDPMVKMSIRYSNGDMSYEIRFSSCSFSKYRTESTNAFLRYSHGQVVATQL